MLDHPFFAKFRHRLLGPSCPFRTALTPTRPTAAAVDAEARALHPLQQVPQAHCVPLVARRQQRGLRHHVGQLRAAAALGGGGNGGRGALQVQLGLQGDSPVRATWREWNGVASCISVSLHASHAGCHILHALQNWKLCTAPGHARAPGGLPCTHTLHSTGRNAERFMHAQLCG